jgi:hypothetical protein
MSKTVIIVLLILHSTFAPVFNNITGVAVRDFEPFTATKTTGNVAACLVLMEPSQSLNQVSLLQCINVCRKVSRNSTCVGVNYHNGSLCELFAADAVSYVNRSGCTYYKVIMLKTITV